MKEHRERARKMLSIKSGLEGRSQGAPQVMTGEAGAQHITIPVNQISQVLQT